MKKGKGKLKGSSFERRISKVFDMWWKVPPHTFWRSVNSGGNWEPGDIVPRDRSINFPFIVECKFYKQWDFLKFFKNYKKSLIYSWWSQITETKMKFDKENIKKRLLIIKFNNYPVLCVYALEDFPNYDKFSIVIPSFYLENGFNDSLCITLLEDFVKFYNPKEFLNTKIKEK
jgi:hypothetical protein